MRALPLALLFLFARPARADAVDDVLKVWDTNGDGVLTRDEVPDPDVFAKVDKDKDGKATRAEIAAFLEPASKPGKRGAPKKKEPKKDAKATEAAMVSPRSVKERVADFFKRYDKNGDKRVSRDEFPTGEEVFKEWDRDKNGLTESEVSRYFTAWLRRQRRRPRPDNFFELFDFNRDNKVTRKEYKGGPREFFRAYDHDKNGTVTLDELNMGPDAGRDRRPSRADKELMADGPTTMPKQTLLDRYDKDGDGRITLEEFNGAESILTRLDKNGDGALTGPECR